MYADLRTQRADAEIAPNHPFAQHLRRAEVMETANPHRAWTPADGALPAIYLSHGAPMLFEMADWMTQLHDWARALPKPTGIVIVSAHWEQAPLSLSVSKPAELVYDFGGFDPMYYKMRYDTPDSAHLADRVRALMPDTEVVHQHTSRGLDHGAWVPLKIMYPAGDIPVLQVSMPTHDADRLMVLGARLRDLRAEGVLIVGSGYMTHGLPYIDWHHPERVPGWSRDFDLWAAETLQRGDLETLSAFRSAAPGMPYAHPTVEHFTPIFVTLGAADDATNVATTRIDGYAIGLAKRSIEVA